MNRLHPLDRAEAECPNRKRHRIGPLNYNDRPEWAAALLKTHDCTKCEGCGLYVIWTSKTSTPQGEPMTIKADKKYRTPSGLVVTALSDYIDPSGVCAVKFYTTGMTARFKADALTEIIEYPHVFRRYHDDGELSDTYTNLEIARRYGDPCEVLEFHPDGTTTLHPKEHA